MSARLGIGIITCNRRDVLAETVARVRSHTPPPFTLVVADDGSSFNRYAGVHPRAKSLGIPSI
jgi:GT2 family glycosyltransferase